MVVLSYNEFYGVKKVYQPSLQVVKPRKKGFKELFTVETGSGLEKEGAQAVCEGGTRLPAYLGLNFLSH